MKRIILASLTTLRKSDIAQTIMFGVIFRALYLATVYLIWLPISQYINGEEVDLFPIAFGFAYIFSVRVLEMAIESFVYRFKK